MPKELGTAACPHNPLCFLIPGQGLGIGTSVRRLSCALGRCAYQLVISTDGVMASPGFPVDARKRDMASGGAFLYA